MFGRNTKAERCPLWVIRDVAIRCQVLMSALTQKRTFVRRPSMSASCQEPTSRRFHSITFVRDLTRCETEIGRLPVGGGNQAFGHQQEGREDQGVDNRDRDHASGKAAVVVIKVCP